MEYELNYLYHDGCDCIKAMCLSFDKVIVNIWLNRKIHTLDIKFYKKIILKEGKYYYE